MILLGGITMKKKLFIDGMTCSNCADHITEALGEMQGVESVKVDIDDMSAEIELTEDIDDDEFKYVIDDMGYELIDVAEM